MRHQCRKKMGQAERFQYLRSFCMFYFVCFPVFSRCVMFGYQELEISHETLQKGLCFAVLLRFQLNNILEGQF